MRWWIVGFAVAAIVTLAMATSGEQQVIVMESAAEGEQELGASLSYPAHIRPAVGERFLVAHTIWSRDGGLVFPTFGMASIRSEGCEPEGLVTQTVSGESQRATFFLRMTANLCTFTTNFTTCNLGCTLTTDVSVLGGAVQGPGDNVTLSGSVSEATLADQIPFLVFGGLFLWGLLNGWLVVAYIGTLGVLLTQIDTPLPYGEPYVVLLALVLLWVVFLGRRFRPIREE